LLPPNLLKPLAIVNQSARIL